MWDTLISWTAMIPRNGRNFRQRPRFWYHCSRIPRKISISLSLSYTGTSMADWFPGGPQQTNEQCSGPLSRAARARKGWKKAKHGVSSRVLIECDGERECRRRRKVVGVMTCGSTLPEVRWLDSRSCGGSLKPEASAASPIATVVPAILRLCWKKSHTIETKYEEDRYLWI